MALVGDAAEHHQRRPFMLLRWICVSVVRQRTSKSGNGTANQKKAAYFDVLFRDLEKKISHRKA